MMKNHDLYLDRQSANRLAILRGPARTSDIARFLVEDWWEIEHRFGMLNLIHPLEIDRKGYETQPKRSP
jgi:hypothetical protein